MPIKGQPDKFGDLYVKFQVVFPDEISSDQRNALVQFFPQIPLDPEELKQATEQLDFEKTNVEEEEGEEHHNPHYEDDVEYGEGDEAGEEGASEDGEQRSGCVQQ